MTLTLQFQCCRLDKPNIFTKSEVQSLGDTPLLSSQGFLGKFTQYINVCSVCFLSLCRLQLSHAVLFFYQLHFFQGLSEFAASYFKGNEFLANLHLFAAMGFQYLFIVLQVQKIRVASRLRHQYPVVAQKMCSSFRGFSLSYYLLFIQNALLHTYYILCQYRVLYKVHMFSHIIHCYNSMSVLIEQLLWRLFMFCYSDKTKQDIIQLLPLCAKFLVVSNLMRCSTYSLQGCPIFVGIQ